MNVFSHRDGIFRRLFSIVINLSFIFSYLFMSFTSSGALAFLHDVESMDFYAVHDSEFGSRLLIRSKFLGDDVFQDAYLSWYHSDKGVDSGRWEGSLVESGDFLNAFEFRFSDSGIILRKRSDIDSSACFNVLISHDGNVRIRNFSIEGKSHFYSSHQISLEEGAVISGGPVSFSARGFEACDNSKIDTDHKVTVSVDCREEQDTVSPLYIAKGAQIYSQDNISFNLLNFSVHQFGENHGEINSMGRLQVAGHGTVKNYGSLLGNDGVYVGKGAILENHDVFDCNHLYLDDRGGFRNFAQAKVIKSLDMQGFDLFENYAELIAPLIRLSGRTIVNKGTLHSESTLELEASKVLRTSDGTLWADQDMRLKTDEFIGDGAAIAAGHRVNLRAKTVDVSGAALKASRAVFGCQTVGSSGDHQGLPCTFIGDELCFDIDSDFSLHQELVVRGKLRFQGQMVDPVMILLRNNLTVEKGLEAQTHGHDIVVKGEGEEFPILRIFDHLEIEAKLFDIAQGIVVADKATLNTTDRWHVGRLVKSKTEGWGINYAAQCNLSNYSTVFKPEEFSIHNGLLIQPMMTKNGSALEVLGDLNTLAPSIVDEGVINVYGDINGRCSDHVKIRSALFKVGGNWSLQTPKVLLERTKLRVYRTRLISKSPNIAFFNCDPDARIVAPLTYRKPCAHCGYGLYNGKKKLDHFVFGRYRLAIPAQADYDGTCIRHSRDCWNQICQDFGIDSPSILPNGVLAQYATYLNSTPAVFNIGGNVTNISVIHSQASNVMIHGALGCPLQEEVVKSIGLWYEIDLGTHQGHKNPLVTYNLTQTIISPQSSIGGGVQVISDSEVQIHPHHLQTPLMFVEGRGGLVKLGRACSMTEHQRFMRTLDSLSLGPQLFSFPDPLKDLIPELFHIDTTGSDRHRIKPRFYTPDLTSYQEMAPQFIVYDFGTPHMRIELATEDTRFAFSPDLEVDNLPRLLMKALGRGYLDDRHTRPIDGYRALRENSLKVIKSHFPGILHKTQGEFERVGRPLQLMGPHANLTDPCLLYIPEQTSEGHTVYQPHCLFPQDFIPKYKNYPGGYNAINAIKVNLTDIPTEQLANSLQNGNPQLALTHGDQQLPSSNFINLGIVHAQQSLIAVTNDIQQDGQLSVDQLSALFSIKGNFVSTCNTEYQQRTNGYQSIRTPQPTTESVNAQLVVITGGNVVAQGAHMEGAEIYLIAEGSIYSLPVQTYERFVEYHSDGYTEFESVQNHGSSFKAKERNIHMLAGHKVCMVTGTLDAKKLIEIHGSQGVKVLPAHDCYSQHTVEDSSNLFGSDHYESFHSEQIVNRAKFNAGAGVRFSTSSDSEAGVSLTAPEIKAPLIRFKTLLLELLAAQESSHTVIQEQSQDGMMSTSRQETTKETRHVFPHLEGKPVLEPLDDKMWGKEKEELEPAPKPKVVLQTPETGMLEWQTNLINDVRHLMDSANPEDQQALANLPTIITNTVHDHFEHHVEEHKTVGPVLRLCIAAVITLASYGVFGPATGAVGAASAGSSSASAAAVGAGASASAAGASAAVGTAASASGASAAAAGAAASQFSLGATLTAAGKAVAVSACNKLTCSLIENDGDLCKGFSELCSGDSLKSLAITGVAAMVGCNLDINADTEFLDRVWKNGVEAMTESSLRVAFFNESIESAAKSAVAKTIGNTIGQIGAREIGDLYGNNFIDYFEHKGLHFLSGATTGAIKSAVLGENVGMGALSGGAGAAISEITAEFFQDNVQYNVNRRVSALRATGAPVTQEQIRKIVHDESCVAVEISKLTAGLSTFAFGGNVNYAQDAAANALQNNFLYGLESMASEYAVGSKIDNLRQRQRQTDDFLEWLDLEMDVQKLDAGREYCDAVLAAQGASMLDDMTGNVISSGIRSSILFIDGHARPVVDYLFARPETEWLADGIDGYNSVRIRQQLNIDQQYARELENPYLSSFARSQLEELRDNNWDVLESYKIDNTRIGVGMMAATVAFDLGGGVFSKVKKLADPIVKILRIGARTARATRTAAAFQHEIPLFNIKWSTATQAPKTMLHTGNNSPHALLGSGYSLRSLDISHTVGIADSFAMNGYHLRQLGDRLIVARNPGMGHLPRLEIQGDKVVSPVFKYRKLSPYQSQIALNRQAGREFQDAVQHALYAKENHQVFKMELLDGRVVPIKPDLYSPLYGVTEIKNVINIGNLPQLRAEARLASPESGMPFNLIISPRTKTIHENVMANIKIKGGKIFEFNPTTGTFKEIKNTGKKFTR